MNRTKLVFSGFLCLLYLPARALVLHGDQMVVFVLRLGAELAHAPLLVPAEHLQQPLVLLAHPLGEVLHRRDQLVKLQGGHVPVRLQVSSAVRGQADQAGLEGFHPQGGGGADVTHHLARLGRGCSRSLGTAHQVPEGLRQLLEGRVDADLRPAAEGSPAGGALTDLAAVPRLLDAGLAEVMAARSGDRVYQHLPAEGALELLL